MKLLAKRGLVIATVAISGLAMLGVEQASAQFLFERLFGGRNIRRVEPEPKPEPVVIPKVASPQYYTYKVDSLVRVDFGALISALNDPADETDEAATGSIMVAAVAEPGQAPAIHLPAVDDTATTFAEAIGHLSEFELLAEEDIAAALLAHYTANPEFMWLRDGKPSHRAEEALAVLAEAPRHGLRASDYAVPALDRPAADGEAIDEALRRAEFEMMLSARVLRYARDAYGGRIDPNRISGYHDFKLKTVDYGHALEVLGDTFAVRTYMESWHPQNGAYAALMAELAELRASEENAIVVSPDLFLRPGGSSPEFAKLLAIIERDADDAMRAEFGELLTASAGTEVYSNELVPLIKAAQEKAGAKPDGIIGPRTVEAIAGDSKADRMDKVRIAMEQLRWLPSQFGQRHVFINVAEFRARYFDEGVEKLSMKAVVGMASKQTFFFQDEVEYVEFHPYWGIPRSILVNKYLPTLVSDPGYLDRIGYEVTDGRGRRVSSASIDWTAYGARPPFDVRQPPGPRNSLGEMKIMFPNRHAIYMHDTPEKHLFDRESRAYSSGCVRLQDPRAMAAAVLGWDREQVEERLRGGHGQEDVPVKIPVYVSYFTAWPDQAGVVNYVPDVYNRDSYVLKAMDKLNEVRTPEV
ncbi:MAG: L,D-transpeptidase family protein [Rhizobiaceae bacterium]|nr:L,D-transpeptidase family protein [Rhizobiaceae bacterium]